MKKIIKYTFYIFLALFVVMILARIFLMKSSSIMSEITPTDNAKAAYTQNGEILTHEITAEISNEGLTRVYSFVWIPKAGEVQLTVKYNQSLFERAKLDSADDISFMLYDTETQNKFYPTLREDVSEGIYGYARLVFEGVSFSENADLELVTSNKDRTEDYSVFKVRRADQVFEGYELSDEEKTKLGG